MIGISLIFVFIDAYFNFFRPRPKYPLFLDGHVATGFEAVKEAFKQNFENGYDLEGAAFSVCQKGRIVVDIWGGYSDSSKNRTWDRDTLSIAYSTTKAALALFDEKITYELIRNHSAMSGVIENQRPNWKIDQSKSGYHVMTHGFLVDQLIRRVDPKHRSLGRFFSEEIAKPYNLDFYIGLSPEMGPRVAWVFPPRNKELIYAMKDYRMAFFFLVYHFKGADSLLKKVVRNPSWLLVDDEVPTLRWHCTILQGNTAFNEPEAQQLEIGSAMGIGTARALAHLMCLMAPGRLINQSTFDRIKNPIFERNHDEVLSFPMTYGHGFEYAPNTEGTYTIGHTGYGGQNANFDPKYNVGIGYLRNGMSHLSGELNWSYKNLKEALYKILASKN